MSFITCVCCIFTTLTYAQWICSSDRWPCIADLNGIILYYYIRVLYILFVVEMLYYYDYMLYYITLRYPLNSSIIWSMYSTNSHILTDNTNECHVNPIPYPIYHHFHNKGIFITKCEQEKMINHELCLICYDIACSDYAWKCSVCRVLWTGLLKSIVNYNDSNRCSISYQFILHAKCNNQQRGLTIYWLELDLYIG